jgi:hypothetical protein
MTTIASDVIQTQMTSILRNPKAVVKTSLDLLETLTNGEVVIVDASNPFVYSLELSAILAANGLIQAESLGRKLYPAMAKTQEDLYLHMADEDYLGRFATPGETIVGFLCPLADILGNAVAINDGSGAKALVLPRHTSVVIDNMTFTLQYPLVIKVLYNNTIVCYLDVTSRTPTYLPATNMITWTKHQFDSTDYFMADVPMQQVKIISQTIQLTSFTGYSKSFSFDDSFYFARAYVRDSSNNWKEISVTHQEQVYNPNKATVCLQVLNSSVNVYIPQIYFQNGLISGSIRLDIYTTLGKIDADITEAQYSSNKIKYTDLDAALTVYSTPFNKFTNIAAIARKRAYGGTAPLTFAELARRVTLRSAVTEGLPITDNQLSSRLKNLGWDVVTTLDNVTRRQYTLVKEVDPPEDKSTVTGLGCSIQLVELSLDDLEVNPIVFNSTKRATLPPTKLLIHDNQGIRVLTDAQRDVLVATANASPDNIANIVNATQYHYTPFHYILDMSLTNLTVRPYFMTSPAIESRYLYQQNDGLSVNIRSSKHGIQYYSDGSGYRITVVLENTTTLAAFTADKVSAQLSYVVPNSTKRAWLTGNLITPIDSSTGKPQNDAWIYGFDIHSTFDINSDHELDVTDTGYNIALTQEFDLLLVLKDYKPDEASYGDIDTIISANNIVDYDSSSSYIGATQEKLTYTFGHYLKHLWRRSRTVTDNLEYQRYTEDVPAYWTKDIYETDASGTPVIDYNHSTGEITLNKLHSSGDPILDADGNSVTLHKVGDPILDNDGNPIPVKSEYELTRQVDLFLADGRYFFATDNSTLEYLDTSLNTIKDWIIDDLVRYQARTLEETNLYYYPKSTNGLIDVIVGDGTMTRLKADQSLQVTYTLRREKYTNPEIRESLTDNTPTMLLQAFKQLQKVNSGVLTKTDIISFIKELLKNDIVDVSITGFLEDKYKAVLLSDVSAIPTIGKKLVALSNLTLQVRDDVDVGFEVLDKEPINSYTLNKNKS